MDQREEGFAPRRGRFWRQAGERGAFLACSRQLSRRGSGGEESCTHHRRRSTCTATCCGSQLADDAWTVMEARHRHRRASGLARDARRPGPRFSWTLVLPGHERPSRCWSRLTRGPGHARHPGHASHLAADRGRWSAGAWPRVTAAMLAERPGSVDKVAASPAPRPCARRGDRTDEGRGAHG